jgi:hypothetical protein
VAYDTIQQESFKNKEARISGFELEGICESTSALSTHSLLFLAGYQVKYMLQNSKNFFFLF